MRLKTLTELREKFERRERFLLIQGEEITDSFQGRPVHVNALNITALVDPQGGDSVRDVMNRNVDAVFAHGRASRKPVLAHINHPNFGWALSWEDIAHVARDRFFAFQLLRPFDESQDNHQTIGIHFRNITIAIDRQDSFTVENDVGVDDNRGRCHHGGRGGAVKCVRTASRRNGVPDPLWQAL